MKTITKKLAILGVMTVGFIGCAENNEKNVMTDPTGKVQTGGVTPANAPKSSKDFMNGNQGAMSNKDTAKKYQDATK